MELPRLKNVQLTLKVTKQVNDAITALPKLDITRATSAIELLQTLKAICKL
ncbi:hypothetical protein [Nostoc sp. CCY0012]|uniref:hypothetical protein n=1 Tax=Nostoc sp. CCY0012 TaxID=1056123 RepID=UPI0039C7573C